MTLRFALFSSLALVTAVPAASAQSRVVVMGAAPARDAIGAALRVELASRRTEVLVADAPLGDSRVGRAASAQASARVAGADAAVWTERVDEGGGAVDVVRVAPASDVDARQAPVPAGADARAVAVVAASLLAELLAPPEPAPTPAVDVTVHATVEVHVHVPGGDTPTALTAPLHMGVAAPPSRQVVPTPSRPSLPKGALPLDLGVAVGGASVFNDSELDAAMLVRGTIGARLDRIVRLAIDADLLGVYENAGDAFRPTVRLGPSLELVVPLGHCVALRLGAHVRGALSSTWQYDGRAITPGGRVGLTSATLAWGVSAGGSVAVSVPLRSDLALDVALDVDGMAREVAGRTPWVVPSLLVGLTWS